MRTAGFSVSFHLLCLAAIISASCAGLPSAVAEPDSAPDDRTVPSDAAPAASEQPAAAPSVLSPEERASLAGTALVVINLQAGKLPVVDEGTVLGGIARLARAAGEAGAPVLWG